MMPNSTDGLPSPLTSIAGSGLAGALRDFLAPAADAPGTPPEHKHWDHLARYLSEEPDAWRSPFRAAALLCSEGFRDEWFRYVAPLPPAYRVPAFFHMLATRVCGSDGEITLRDAIGAARAGTAAGWRFPDAHGKWPAVPTGRPAFNRRWYRATGSPDAEIGYREWSSGFARLLAQFVRSIQSKDMEAWLLTLSLAARISFFDEAEMEEIAKHRPTDFSFRKDIGAWFKEAGIAQDRASAAVQRMAAKLETFGSYSDDAVIWIGRTPAGQAFASRFGNRRLEDAMEWPDNSDVATAAKLASIEALDLAVPRMLALISIIAKRDVASQAAIGEFRREAGPERADLISDRAAAVIDFGERVKEGRRSRQG